MESRKVFISSTTTDLAQYRQRAVTVMEDLNQDRMGKFQLVPIHMDNQGQTGERMTPLKVSLSWVEEADWMVLIVGWNYGHVEDGQERSLTECEYRHAREALAPPKPCFVFMAGESNDSERYERKEPGKEQNLRDWAVPPGKAQEMAFWTGRWQKLMDFKKDLRAAEFNLFTDIDDFARKLAQSFKQRIEKESQPPGRLIIDIIAQDKALLGLILAMSKPIQAFTWEIKQLAKLKRIHDHLHHIRQDGICLWRSEVVSLWEEGGPIDPDTKLAYVDVLGSVRESRSPLRDLKDELPSSPCCRLDRLVQDVLDFDLPTKDGISGLAKKEFEVKVNDFARQVQKAFEKADLAMTERKQALKDQHTIMLKEFSAARRDSALSDEQDSLLDEGLEQLERRLKEMDAVLIRHSRWQAIHNALEDLDPFVERETEFADELRRFLQYYAEEILALVEEAAGVLSRLDADVFASKARAIQALAGADPNQRAGLGPAAYDAMRKAFDLLFFEMDKETLAFVDESDKRVKRFEEKLRRLEEGIRRRAVPARQPMNLAQSGETQ